MAKNTKQNSYMCCKKARRKYQDEKITILRVSISENLVELIEFKMKQKKAGFIRQSINEYMVKDEIKDKTKSKEKIDIKEEICKIESTDMPKSLMQLNLNNRSPKRIHLK